MESPGPEKFSGGRKKVVDKLLQGRDFAAQLQLILRDSTGDHVSVTAKELVPRILKSFTEAIAALSSGESGEVSGDPATAEAGLPCYDGQRNEDSGEKRKKSASIDQRRGGYKRRKMIETSIHTTSTPIEDGYSWRKYGQKEILNAKFPRSYFRCTHKHDQGCQATKQVQKTEDEIPMYRTTYIGQHTCRDVLKAPQFVMDDIPKEAFLFTFESTNTTTTTKEDLNSGFPSVPLSSIKAEFKEEPGLTTDDHPMAHDNQSSSDNYFLLPDLKPLDSSGPTSVLPSTPGSDYGDVSGVYSCTTSSHSSFDMGMDSIDHMASVNFDDFINFDHEETFFSV
ncbi:probable WRKY transcription factor 70 [Macadamia integrifolia]|uniref:probable WRKY transcription factor 70 n=1 Tax=Macadamia integrifolia TaxID=60698 RepID=UPI001C4FB39D|nr:probable WRKY transcription factor 70 [Macadamia integrifolia]